MKKILVIVFVLIASYSYAQDLKFGAKAGLNLTNIVGDDVEDVDIKAGLYFGGFMNISLSDHLSFQPEILYSMQGWKIDDEGDDMTIKTSYINVPLLLKMSLGGSGKIHIYAGPQLGFLLDAEVDYDNDFGSGTEDLKDYINNVDFSLNLGLSFDVSDNMSLDIRYNRGLSNIIDDEEDGDAKAFNSGFQLGASYSF
jgi:opacity protein-like surface antigen